MITGEIESLVSAYGLPKVLERLRIVVYDMAKEQNDPRLWWLESDLSQALCDFADEDV